MFFRMRFLASLALILVVLEHHDAKLSDQRLCADPNCSGENLHAPIIVLIIIILLDKCTFSEPWL